MCKYGITTNNRSLKNDLTGKKFNRLTVKYQTKFENGRGGWYCECECGESTIVRSDDLKNGNVKSCGKCSYNTYEFKEDYVIGYSTNGLLFYFDLDDYNRVSQHTWRVNKKSKRVCATINKETVHLHQFIMNVLHAEAIDHIDGNPTNNRKYNLRYCTIQQNCCNQKLHKNNTSGITGVWWSNEKSCWVAELMYKHKKVLYEYCNNFIEAVIKRIKAEVKYFKEYRSTRNDVNINNTLLEHGFTLEEILNLGVDTY